MEEGQNCISMMHKQIQWPTVLILGIIHTENFILTVIIVRLKIA